MPDDDFRKKLEEIQRRGQKEAQRAQGGASAMPQKTGLVDDFEVFAASAVGKVSAAGRSLQQFFRPKPSGAAQQRILRHGERATMLTVTECAESPEGDSNRASGGAAEQQFGQRTFLLPEEQAQEDESDQVQITLRHECDTPGCRRVLEGDRITKKCRREKYFDQEAGQEKIRFEWYCDGCREAIQPLIRVQVGGGPERACDEVPLFHPVGLRNLLEIHLGVDNNYRSLYQRDVGLLRRNKNIYWNMIFYF